MNSHEIKKPVVFISHATSDAEFANAVKQEIEKVFANGVSVYCTSSPGAITPGKDWLSDMEHKLATNQAVVVIITPVSIERPWLWFEIGATWSRGRGGETRIYPLCAPEIDLARLPPPLDRLQALSMGKAMDLKLFFKALIAQFNFGNITTFRAENIIKRIPKYKNVKITDADLNERALYSGRYSGYNDNELMEVIDSQLFLPDAKNHENFGLLYDNREDLIHNGKLLHFRQIDRELDLPPGTARRLLNKVAKRYNLEPTLESDNIVRYS